MLSRYVALGIVLAAVPAIAVGALEPPRITHTTQATATLDGHWVLKGWGNPTRLTPPVSGSTITATFDGGRLSGSAGCNRYNTLYQTMGDTLALGAIAATRRACEPSILDQELKFLGALGRVQTYELSDHGELHIGYTSDQGDGVLVFVSHAIRGLW